MIALCYAMPREIESLVGKDRVPDAKAAGVSFYHLSEDLVACCGGVGKVNAAMAAQLCIDRYHPALILNAGVAGCFEEVPIGTLVLCHGFVQHDVDTTKVGDPIGMVSTVEMVEFPTADLDAARAAMDKTGYPYRVGLCATGDWFGVSCPRADFIRDTFHPLLCEMEGGAIAQVCYRNEVPFMALKSVSDCLTSHHDSDFNFPAAMRDLNTVVMAFLQVLKG